MKKSSQLLKFTRTCLYLARQRIPPYSGKFSKHTFTQPQLAVLYGLGAIAALHYSAEGLPAAELGDLESAAADERFRGGRDRSYASRYYTQRIKLKLRALKITLLVDTFAQTVLDLHVTTTRKGAHGAESGAVRDVSGRQRLR